MRSYNNIRYRVWNEESKNDAKEEDVFFRLLDATHNDVALVCVDKDGNPVHLGNILVIDSDLMAIVLIPDINDSIPLKTDVVSESVICVKSHEVETFNELKRRKSIAAILSEHVKTTIEENIQKENEDSTKH